MTDSRDHDRWMESLDLRLHAASTPEPEDALKRLTLNRLRSEFADARAPASGRDRLAEISSAIREVVATLVTGTSLAGAVGVRGGRSGAPRLMVWETDDHSFSVSFLDDAAGHMSVRGQVAPRRTHQLAAGTAVLLQGEERIESAISSTGQFTFSSVSRGSVRLEVLMGEERVHLGPVDLHDLRS